jgi:hypothetical protein
LVRLPGRQPPGEPLLRRKYMFIVGDFTFRGYKKPEVKTQITKEDLIKCKENIDYQVINVLNLTYFEPEKNQWIEFVCDSMHKLSCVEANYCDFWPIHLVDYAKKEFKKRDIYVSEDAKIFPIIFDLIEDYITLRLSHGK